MDILAILNSHKYKYDINQELILSIESLTSSMTYAAPEILNTNFYFIKLGRVLNTHISKEDYENQEKPWAKQIIDIFLDPEYKKQI